MNKFYTLIILVFMFFGAIAQENKKVTISTPHGDIVIALYAETPLHQKNFLKLVKEGFYNETLFHRVIPGFMIQGGDPDSRGAKAGQALGNGGPGYKIKAEIDPKLFHKRGALAAARLGDAVNPKKESSGSQFYIVDGQIYSDEKLNEMEKRSGKRMTKEQRIAYTTIGGTPHLDGNYTVFGEVLMGLDVITKIANSKRDGNDRPLKDVSMRIK